MSYITPNELDGEVNTKLLKILNGVVRCLRSVFHFHCFVKGNHAPNGYHPKGEATDGHKGSFRAERKPNDYDIQIIAGNLRKLIDKPDKTIFEQAVIAYLRGICGVGIYPHWKPRPGLHMDIRENKLVWLGLSRKQVMKELEKQEGSQIYFYLT